jgi:hypothetical protein
MLAPVDTLVRRYRRTVLVGALAVAIASCALLPLVSFDFDPLNLKSAKVESMTALQALSSDPDWTPDAINILSPSLAASEPLVSRLDALPAVSRTVTLNSFVPAQQKEKLALIGNAATLLKPVLDVAPLAPPSDPELQQSLAATAASLRRVTADATGAAAVSARRLADVLERLQAATPDVRVAAAFAGRAGDAEDTAS